MQIHQPPAYIKQRGVKIPHQSFTTPTTPRGENVEILVGAFGATTMQQIIVCDCDDRDHRMWPPKMVSEAKKRRIAKRFLSQCGFNYDMIRNMATEMLVYMCQIQRRVAGAMYVRRKTNVGNFAT